MVIEDLFYNRKGILADAKDMHGFIQQNLILDEVLPHLLAEKLVDSEDYNEAYSVSAVENSKVNGYAVSESGERLRLFIVNEDSIQESLDEEALSISTKDYYDTQFKRAIRFVKKAIDGQLTEKIQDSDPAKALVAQLSSSAGIDQFDVIEIFLVSLTATVSFKGSVPQPRRINFPTDTIKVTYRDDNDVKKRKELSLFRQVVDLNFVTAAVTAKGNSQPLTVNFRKDLGHDVEVINAADETNFASYLCVLDAKLLADLYRRYSTRLLEKNVRSFLQFKGVNKGIKDTIRDEPEKFIAYNNGLTITATAAKVFDRKKKTYIESLTDFQIVNGGQTTASIYFSNKEGLDISKVKVMAKINVAKESANESLDDLISKISKFSNTQSRVSNVDLRARNTQLVKLKKLSENITTPSGCKWFFERAKGDFNTSVRFDSKIKRDFPNERRFSKEQLAKYYAAWGEIPHMVKKGGERIFRHFIEDISPEQATKSPIVIDRSFYEALIAKIILFRRLEKIYGQGKSAMGQLRSAAIPYTISVIYLHTDGAKADKCFDLAVIWKKEGLPDDLAVHFEALLLLVNGLIKKYSASDDYGEFSKKVELWENIKQSKEIESFMGSEMSIQVLKKYMVD